MLSVVIVFVGIVIFNRMQTESFDAATTIFVQQKVASVDEGTDYKYDGYYAVLANEEFADTVESWLNSPDIVQEIYDRAQITAPADMAGLSNLFDINKVISQSVQVKMNFGSKIEAEKMMSAMLEVVKEKVENALRLKDGNPIFTIGNSDVLVLVHKVDYNMQFGIGFIGALCVGVFLAYFMYAVSEEKDKK